MMHLNWDRLTVLVVDDNKFVRRLLESTLRSFGIENLISEGDAANAIKRLRLSKTDPVKAGVGSIDLILSDYVMPGVDGGLFLRWLRTDEQAPDHFVPFIMVSGAADREVVELARDAGVSEFLAKPFSAKSIADCILRVINKPRRFVLANGYFGPDRRRVAKPRANERRITEPSQVQTLRRESHNIELRDDLRAIHFLLPNKLEDKLGANALKGEIGLDPMVIHAAEARIQSMVGDYTDWVGKHLQRMSRSLSVLVSVSGDDQEAINTVNRKPVAEINRIAHELRGQGGIFGYPLITALGKSLYKTTLDPLMIITEERRTLIEAHIDAIRTVFREKISGNGGEVGSALLREINTAVKRYQSGQTARPKGKETRSRQGETGSDRPTEKHP